MSVTQCQSYIYFSMNRILHCSLPVFYFYSFYFKIKLFKNKTVFLNVIPWKYFFLSSGCIGILHSASVSSLMFQHNSEKINLLPFLCLQQKLCYMYQNQPLWTKHFFMSTWDDGLNFLSRPLSSAVSLSSFMAWNLRTLPDKGYFLAEP